MASQVYKGTFQLIEVENSTENSCQDSGEESHLIECFLVIHEVVGVGKDCFNREVRSSVL